MELGDVKRILGNQNYTVYAALNQLCIIEKFERDGGMYVRIEGKQGEHYHQHVYKHHLTDP